LFSDEGDEAIHQRALPNARRTRDSDQPCLSRVGKDPLHQLYGLRGLPLIFQQRDDSGSRCVISRHEPVNHLSIASGLVTPFKQLIPFEAPTTMYATSLMSNSDG
jgi:hypothetical protein